MLLNSADDQCISRLFSVSCSPFCCNLDLSAGICFSKVKSLSPVSKEERSTAKVSSEKRESCHSLLQLFTANGPDTDFSGVSAV